MKDFESEISMYACLKQLLENILPNIKLYGDVEDIIRVYEKLYTKGIVTDHELVVLKQFINYNK